MLSNANIQNSLGVARLLKQSGLDFVPVAGSPLQELFEASNADISLGKPEETTAAMLISNGGELPNQAMKTEESFIEEVAYLTRGYSEETRHTLIMRNLADDVAPFITSHLSFARNTVVPLIKEAEEAFGRFLSLGAVAAPEASFMISKGVVPALALDESFVSNNLEHYNGDGAFEKFYYEMQLKTPEDFAGFIASVKSLGSARLSGLLEKWLEKAPYKLLERVWFINFTREYDTNAAFEKDIDSAGNPIKQQIDWHTDYGFTTDTLRYSAYDSLNTSLATFILASYALANPMETEGDVGTLEYKQKLEELITVSGIVVNRLIKRIKLQVESNVLVSSYNSIQKKIIVNGSIYEEWLQQGGVPEALLGFLVSNNKIMDARIALEQKQTGCRAWELYCGLAHNQAKTTLEQSFVSYIKSYMLSTLAELTDSEKEIGVSPAVHRERVISNVDKEIEHFSHRLMDDIPHLVLHLVARARFYYTSAYEILLTMHEVFKMNPEIDPREAAGIATQEYIAEYLAGQIRRVNA